MPTFSVDWFRDNIPVWEKHVLPRLTKHPIRFLEIGSFEGRSACWLLENALTDARDRLTCVDTFGEHNGVRNYEATFDQNMVAIGAGTRLQKKRGRSFDVLRELTHGAYDACYIDGSHAYADVLTDGLMCFKLVRVGGFLLFDDYARAPESALVAEAVADCLRVLGDAARVVFKDWQVMVERVR